MLQKGANPSLKRGNHRTDYLVGQCETCSLYKRRVQPPFPDECLFILIFIIYSSFCRNLFARKQNAGLEKQNDLGWKLFGKTPVGENSQKDPKKIQKVFFLILYFAGYYPCPVQFNYSNFVLASKAYLKGLGKIIYKDILKKICFVMCSHWNDLLIYYSSSEATTCSMLFLIGYFLNQAIPFV